MSKEMIDYVKEQISKDKINKITNQKTKKKLLTRSAQTATRKFEEDRLQSKGKTPRLKKLDKNVYEIE
jgi:hypothetical protein